MDTILCDEYNIMALQIVESGNIEMFEIFVQNTPIYRTFENLIGELTNHADLYMNNIHIIEIIVESWLKDNVTDWNFFDNKM